MRKCAARIVAHVADEIDLEQFPRGIQGISSLIDTFEEYHRRAFCSDTEYFLEPGLNCPKPCDNDIPNEMDYKELLLDGLYILWVLAADENNCRVISDTEGLIYKIMAPLWSDMLHQIGHGPWSDVVQGSLKVVGRLMVAPGKTGVKLRRDISINKEAIGTMMRIFKCDECKEELQRGAMEILKRLDLDTESRQDFIKMLVDMFIDKGSSSRELLVIEALRLMVLSSQRGIKDFISQLNGDDGFNRLTMELVKCTHTGERRYMISATEILEHLCIHYIKADECLKQLKEVTNDIMRKVHGEATPRGTEEERPGFSSPLEDIEDQHNGAAQDNGRNKSSSSPQENQEQRQDREIQVAWLSLCVTVWDTLISGDEDLALYLHAIDVSSLPLKLKEIVLRNSDPTASCLGILKVTSRMVISMMKHRGSYPKQDLESLGAALSSASTNMLLVDASAVFASPVDGMPRKPARTLTSLVKEAKELVHSYEAEESEIMEAPTPLPVRTEEPR